MEPSSILLSVAGIAVVLVMFVVAARIIESTRNLETQRQVGELRLKVEEYAQFADGTLKRWSAEKKSIEKQRAVLKKKENELLAAEEGEEVGMNGPAKQYSAEYWAERARKQGLLK
jgi:hypothetical protein